MQMNSKNPDCTVVVCSCDKYADLLAPFAALWRGTFYWKADGPKVVAEDGDCVENVN